MIHSPISMLAVLTVSATLFTTPVLADSVTAKFTGVDGGKNYDYSVVLPIGSGNTPTTGTAFTGVMEFTNASGPIQLTADNEFYSFCIDLADDIQLDSTTEWNVTSLFDSPDPSAGPMGLSKANDLASLLGGAVTSGVLNDISGFTPPEQRALQMAVWEVVHENPTNGYDILNGDMQITSMNNGDNQMAKLATGYLSNIGIAPNMEGLVGLTNDNVQDFVAQTTVVPIPAAAWLFGSALLGMVGIGRFRSKK